MRLDSTAIRAFELFSTSYRHGEWLSKPLRDLRHISERQDVVEALGKCPDQRRVLYTLCLPKLPDLVFLARRLLRKKARLIDCYRIAQSIGILRRIERVIRELMENAPEFAPAIRELLLVPVCVGLVQFANFEACVEQTVDAEYYSRTGTLRIRPDVDPELLRISEEIEKLEESCQKAASKLSRYLPDSGVKLDSNTQHGYFYKVTMKEEKALRGVPGVKILDAGKGAGIRFRDATLENLNEEYVELLQVYEEAQKHLEESTVAVCASYAAALSKLATELAAIDVLVAFAVISEEAAKPHIRPVLLPEEEGVFEMKGVRHPVLDTVLHFIPNDVDMSTASALIVTGANMGGKSTYLRAAALTALLAQVGARVPADSVRLSVLSSMFARVGASDKQSRGLSTFMAEMIECAAILQNATSHSLVVIDEIGRGTSTFDGFALAWGITKDLIDRVKCKTLVATHYTELAALTNDTTVRAVQMKVHAESDSLALLYQAADGVADASLGINVAKMVGMDKKVTDNAQAEFDRILAEEKQRKEERERIRGTTDENVIAIS